MNTSDNTSVYPPLSAAVDPARESKATGNLQGIASVFSEVCVRTSRTGRPMWCYTRSSMIPRRNWRSHFDIIDWRKAVRTCSGKTAPNQLSSWLNAIIRPPMNVLPRWVLLDRIRQRRWYCWNTQIVDFSVLAQLHQTRWPGEDVHGSTPRWMLRRIDSCLSAGN